MPPAPVQMHARGRPSMAGQGGSSGGGSWLILAPGVRLQTRWTWDAKKAAANIAKHGVAFDIAALVFRDPFAESRPDPDDEERWQTVGLVDDVMLFVVHTEPEERDGERVGRIISSRRASSRERKKYEEGTFS